MEKENKRNEWYPLESNPKIINEYILSLGFDTSVFSFQELLSVESWAQGMISKPVLGVLLAFPDGDNHKKFKKEQSEKIKEEGQELDKDLFYMHQYAGNACGSVGIFHILGNLPQNQKDFILKDSVIDKFYKDAKDQDWEQRGHSFNNNDVIKRAHVKAVNNGDTEVDLEKVKHHYVSFVLHSGHLYELDGAKQFPINHGKCTEQSFLSDALFVCQQFMSRDPGNSHFSILVLAPPSYDF